MSVKAKKTQTAPAIGPSAGGTAKVRAKKTGRPNAPISMSRRRVPCRARSRSVRAPMIGSMTTSQIFAIVMTMPATIAAMPSESVR